MPTHLADGTELTKSAMKKLAKEQKKHEKQLMNANKKKWKRRRLTEPEKERTSKKVKP